MTQIETFSNSSFSVQCMCVDGNPWFRGNDVAKVLGYSRPRDAIKDHVPDTNKKTLENLMIASGGAKTPPPAIVAPITGDFKCDRSFAVHNETDLHSKVVDYIRRFFPQAKMMAGLGEFQTTSSLRIEGYKKGYQKGTADLMILNKHLDYNGFCVEFKTPKGLGSLSDAQSQWLRDLHLNGYKV